MRAALVVLMAALAGATARAPGASSRPAGRPWTVVQADGTKVVFASAPENRGGRLVGILAGSGTLVSIPAARVDAEATARANAPGEAAPSAVVAKRRPTPHPFATPSLGSQVKLNTSAEEAQRRLEEARTGTAGPAPSPEPSPGAKAADDEPASPGETAPVDLQGRDEEYWRERAGVVRTQAEQAELDLAWAEAELHAAERAYLGGSEGERNSFVLRVTEARDRAERARQEHRRAKGRWDALQEEARKAGAYPGWLR